MHKVKQKLENATFTLISTTATKILYLGVYQTIYIGILQLQGVQLLPANYIPITTCIMLPQVSG